MERSTSLKVSRNFGTELKKWDRMMRGCPEVILTHRNLKYIGFSRRIFQWILIYIKIFGRRFLQPHMTKLENFILQVVGFLLLFVLAPFLGLSAAGLYIFRNFHLLVIPKLYRGSKSIEFSKYSRLDQGNDTLDDEEVLGIVWMNGKVDVEAINNKFVETKPCQLETNLNPMDVDMSMVTSSQFGVIKPVIEISQKLQRKFSEESNRSQSQKPFLQKYISSLLSKELTNEHQPWEIQIFQQPINNRDRIFTFLRFQKEFLSHTYLEQDLLSSIFRKLETDQLKISNSLKQQLDTFQNYGNIYEPLQILLNFGHLIKKRSEDWLKLNFWRCRGDIESWLNLRQKQIQFHSKSKLLMAFVVHVLNSIRTTLGNIRNFTRSKNFEDIISLCYISIILLKALTYVPIKILQAFCISTSLSTYGFERLDSDTERSVTWSLPIPVDLMNAIQEKIPGVSVPSIALMVMAHALRDYYTQCGIRNPYLISVCLPVNRKDFLFPFLGHRVVTIPTSMNNIKSLQVIQEIERQMSGFPIWKILGSQWAASSLLSFLPRSTALQISNTISSSGCPIKFIYTDATSPGEIHPLVPSKSLWGLPVEELAITNYSPMQNTYVSVTLVKYWRSFRLVVVSPMKSVDRVLCKRFPEQLKRLAEVIGVEKSRIPKLQKSSPMTSSSSSPISTVKLNLK